MVQRRKTRAHIESCNQSRQRGSNPPTPHYSMKIPFIDKPSIKFCPTSPLPCCLQLHHCSFCCVVSLAEWVIAPHLIATFLNDIMDVQMLSLRILMHVLCNKVSGLLRSDTWYSFLLVLWFDITHTNKHKHIKDTKCT